jgi:hypothetical protein
MLIRLRSAGSGKTKNWKCALYTVKEGVLAYVCVLRIRKTDSIYINENIIGGSWTAVGNTRTEHQQTVNEHQPRSHPVSCVLDPKLPRDHAKWKLTDSIRHNSSSTHSPPRDGGNSAGTGNIYELWVLQRLKVHIHKYLLNKYCIL